MNKSIDYSFKKTIAGSRFRDGVWFGLLQGVDLFLGIHPNEVETLYSHNKPWEGIKGTHTHIYIYTYIR